MRLKNDEIKNIELATGYDYYIVNSLLIKLVNFRYNYDIKYMNRNCMSVENFYKEYIAEYEKNKNITEQQFLAKVYNNKRIDDIFQDIYLEKDIKEYFKHITNGSCYIAVTKAKTFGNIYFFKSVSHLCGYCDMNKELKDFLEKNSVCQGYPDFIELSDKLLEKHLNERKDKE